MAPLVSILIPAFNAERWLRQTIDSALSQTWSNTEVIIVDDGSSDRTFDVAKTYEGDRVKVVTQNNMGACAARNRAFALSGGDYIQWLDADDILDPTKIARQMERRGRELAQDVDLVLLTSAWGMFYSQTRRAKFIADGLWQDLSPIEWLLTKFEQNVWMNPAAWLVSRRLAMIAGPWDERLSRDQDGEYMCRLVARSRKVAFVPEARCYYRIGNAASVSCARSGKSTESMFVATCLCIDHLRSLRDDERTRAACVRLLQTRVRYFYPDERRILDDAQRVARSLGGNLGPPAQSLGFRFLAKFVGYRTAMKAKMFMWRAGVKSRRQWNDARDLASQMLARALHPSQRGAKV